MSTTQYRRSTVEWAALAAMTFAAGWQVIGPPIVGLANNGDFGKILGVFSLAGTVDDEYKFLSRTYAFDPRHHITYGYASSEHALAAVVIGVNRLFSRSPSKTFDIRFIGAVHAALYLLAFYLLAPLLQHARKTVRAGVYAALILVFSDVMYVCWMNTFYMDSAALVFLFLSAVLYARAVRWRAVADITGFALCAALFAASKTQHSGLAIPVAVLAAITLRPPHRFWVTAVILAAAAIPVIFVDRNYSPTGVYTVVFYEILPHSEAVDRDLAQLGLDQTYRRYIGTYAFSDGSGMNDTGFVRRFSSRTSYLKVTSYFLRHPKRAMEVIADRLSHAGRQRVAMGNFERNTGRPEYSESSRFAVWSGIKARLLENHGLRLLAYFGLAWAALAGALRFRECSIAPALVMAAMGMGALLIAALADAVEVVRHFFLFNAIVDLTLLCAVLVIAAPRHHLSR